MSGFYSKMLINISPRATIFPMHICMISLKNSGLPVIPVRIADLRF